MEAINRLLGAVTGLLEAHSPGERLFVSVQRGHFNTYTHWKIMMLLYTVHLTFVNQTALQPPFSLQPNVHDGCCCRPSIYTPWYHKVIWSLTVTVCLKLPFFWHSHVFIQMKNGCQRTKLNFLTSLYLMYQHTWVQFNLARLYVSVSEISASVEINESMFCDACQTFGKCAYFPHINSRFFLHI